MNKTERINTIMFRVSTVFYFVTGNLHLDAATAKTEDARKEIIRMSETVCRFYQAVQKYSVMLSLAGKLNTEGDELPYPFNELEQMNENEILEWMQKEIIESLEKLKNERTQ